MKKYIVIAAMLLFLVSGCSPASSDEKQNTPQEDDPGAAANQSVEHINLARIHVFIYRENPGKAQPEAVTVISDKAHLQRLEQILHEKKADTDIKISPFKQVYLLSFEYEDENHVKVSEVDYLSVTDEHTTLVKKVEPDNALDFEEYSLKDGAKLIEQAGTQGWSSLNGDISELLNE